MSTITKVFMTFTFLLLGVAGYLAFKNDELYKIEVQDRDDEIVMEANALEDLTNAQNRENALLAAIAEVEAEIVVLETTEANQIETNEELDNSRRKKNTQVTRINGQEDEMLAREEGIRTTVKRSAEFASLTEDIKELTQVTNETQATLDQAIADDNDVKDRINTRRTKFKAISDAVSLDDMKTTIQSIYPTWGFVTLADGDSAGVVDNSPLDIVRDGETIAKLLVTSVEEHSASASIVPGSIAEDVTLMQGDVVVPTKNKSKAEVAEPDADAVILN